MNECLFYKYIFNYDRSLQDHFTLKLKNYEYRKKNRCKLLNTNIMTISKILNK